MKNQLNIEMIGKFLKKKSAKELEFSWPYMAFIFKIASERIPPASIKKYKIGLIDSQ